MSPDNPVDGGKPRPITAEGTTGFLVSTDDKWLIAGRRTGAVTVREAVLVSMDSGNVEPIRGLEPKEEVLGWTGDGQLYVGSEAKGNGAAIHIDKLNPHTGARAAWRDLTMPPIGGVFPDPLLITPDGSMYGFDYRLRLSDLYTVNGVR